MSCNQADVLLCKYNTCKYHDSVYKELFFFHCVFQASKRRVPAKNNPWATGLRPIYVCKFVLIPLYTMLSFQSLKRELKQSQKWLQWIRHYKIDLRSFRFHFSDYAALISFKSNCQELHPYSMLSERKGWVLRMSIALAIHSACRSRVTSHDIHQIECLLAD